jgi:hypothetical protein
VHNIVAGPRLNVAKEELLELLHSMVAEIDRIRLRQSSRHNDLIHSYYWISSVAGLETFPPSRPHPAAAPAPHTPFLHAHSISCSRGGSSG